MTLRFIIPHLNFTFMTYFSFVVLFFIYFDWRFHSQSVNHQNQEQMNFLRFTVWICLKKKKNFSYFSILVIFCLIKEYLQQHETVGNYQLISFWFTLELIFPQFIFESHSITRSHHCDQYFENLFYLLNCYGFLCFRFILSPNLINLRD